MGSSMTSSTVVWGQADYDATDDANGALRSTPRSGDPVRFSLDRALVDAVAGGMTLLPFQTWNFGDSVAFDALVETTEVTGDERWATFVQAWGRSWATRRHPFAALDCTAPGHAMVRVAERYEDAILLDACRDLADYLMDRPSVFGVYRVWERAPLLEPYAGTATPRDVRLLEDPPACVCVDCLHFDAPFLVKLGTLLGDDRYIEAGLVQARGYVKALQRPDGLFDHFRLEGEPDAFGPGWGRGQGWALLGMLDIVEDLRGAGHDLASVDDLALSIRSLVSGMVATQRADGHWPVVVHLPESGDEYSTTAFMLAGFRRALDLGIVDVDAVGPSIASATRALEMSFDEAGNLCRVSAAVYASTVAEHYGAVPVGYVVPWGQGPALLALLAVTEGKDRS